MFHFLYRSAFLSAHRLRGAVVLCCLSVTFTATMKSELVFNVPYLYAAEGQSLPVPEGWSAFQDPKLGATLYYPANWFEPKGLIDGVYHFASRNDEGELLLKSYLDEMRNGADATVSALKESDEAALITDIKSGDNWYELTGKTAEGLNRYTRVVYSCKERVVTEMTLIYPPASAEAYAPVLLKMKRRFQSGIGTETPVRECS